MTAKEEALQFIETRKRAYALAFGSPAGNDVLIDLAAFCRATESCVVPGDRDRTMVAEGRREVWLRIQQHLNLMPEHLFMLYTGRHYITEENQDAA